MAGEEKHEQSQCRLFTHETSCVATGPSLRRHQATQKEARDLGTSLVTTAISLSLLSVDWIPRTLVPPNPEYYTLAPCV